MKFRNSVISVLAVGAIGFALPAFAQEPAPAPVPADPAPAPTAPTEAPAAIDVPDETLESFAVAFLEVAKVSQEYQPQLESAATPEDQQRIRDEAGQKMIDAVEATDGISVDQYQQIMQAAQTDPDLAQRINTHISQASQ